MAELSLALRSLRRNPGFSIVAVLTLALGVGANTAIFSVVKAVLLNPLPYRDPGRLVKIGETDPDTLDAQTVDFTTTWDLRARSRSFESLSLYRYASVAIAEGGNPELLRGLRVNAGYFDTLGVKMALGRPFLAEEDQPDRRYEVILTNALWMRRFGGDRGILGRKLQLSEAAFTVVGVLPPGFQAPFADQSEIFLPLGYALGRPEACRGCQHLQLLGRLKPGISAAAAQAEMNAVIRGIAGEHPQDYAQGIGVVVRPLRDQVVGRVQGALWILLGAVGFVLLIACANVANLVLARATGRVKEIALRAALGASRVRLLRQLLAESVLLALAGGAAGLVLAWYGTQALAALGSRQIPRFDEIRIDAPVLLFGLAASLFTAVLFGLAPALRASRVDLNDALKDTGKSTAGRGRHGFRNLLVSAEFALSFVLVVGAGLLGRSFLHVTRVDLGYDPHNVLTLQTYVYGDRYRKPEAELNYYRQVLDRLRATPGIESAAMVSTLPLHGFDRRSLQIEDQPLANPADAPAADTYSVSPDYFRVMRIPLKRGRLFAAVDGPTTPQVALISESCARTQFANQDPIGKHIQLGGRSEKKPWITIVGIVGNIHQYSPDRPSNMEAYVLQAQDTSFGYSLVARTSVDPRLLERSVREAFLAADKTQPVFDVKPLDAYLSDTLAARTFTLTLLAIFGLLAVTLSAIGIYGVISYAVTLRTREVGIRMALGAERRKVLAMVLAGSLKLIAAGLAAGFFASIALTRILDSLLFEVKPVDLPTSAAVAVALAVVALAASYIPARRAATVDPIVALRYE